MLLLGLLLLAATGAFTGLVIAGNLNTGPSATVTVVGHDIATMSPLAMFLSGMALALILVISAVLLGVGLVRARRRRTEVQAARLVVREAGTTRTEPAPSRTEPTPSRTEPAPRQEPVATRGLNDPAEDNPTPGQAGTDRAGTAKGTSTWWRWNSWHRPVHH
ncbi:hypothetical protein LN042_12560 [Kitasatospora sp. RB6PN24]|uniref:hypothetical protein n=1 Tax=Kitasatospora humi TaxID=2893891 RepID=UPI001E5257B0|nr:hypothetical protein [Kitasatospora humi]MCC9307914.1 hypothetical protein [Kitasatospora humi]